MKKIFLLIVCLYCCNTFSQTSKEVIKELKNEAVLQEIRYNLNNYIKINEISKVDNFNEEITLLNYYNLSDFLPIKLFFIGKIKEDFSTPLVFFPNGFKSGFGEIYFDSLPEKIKNVYAFKNDNKEYFLLEFNEYINYRSQVNFSPRYKDKFLAIEKNELLELIKNLKNIEKEIVEFKNNLEKSKFKLLIFQQDILKEDEIGRDYYNQLKRSLMIPIISNTNYELKKPFDFSKPIGFYGFSFNNDYQKIIEIDGKNLNINKIIYFKDDNNYLKAKISVGLSNLKFFKLNYNKLHSTYFNDWSGDFPDGDRSTFYYYFDSKNTNDLKNMITDNYWEQHFIDEKKFNEILDISELKIEDLIFNSDFDFNNLFGFPKIKFNENNEIYPPNEYFDNETKVGIAVIEMREFSSGFFSNEIKHSLIFNLKKEAKRVLDEKAKETKTIQGNKKFISDMTKKYGKKYVDDALNGDITMGMPEELLPLPLQAWVIKSRDEFPNGYNLYCNFSFNTARKLLITVKNKKVVRISNW